MSYFLYFLLMAFRDGYSKAGLLGHGGHGSELSDLFESDSQTVHAEFGRRIASHWMEFVQFLPRRSVSESPFSDSTLAHVYPQNYYSPF